MTDNAAPVGALRHGTLYYAPIGRLIYDGEDQVRCHLCCGRWLRMMGGTHLRVTRSWTLDAYREAFQLHQSAATCARDVSGRLRQHAIARLGHESFGTPPPGAAPPGYSAVRRELRSLADGASDLARSARGNGKAAEQVAARLQARKRRAREMLTQANQFALDPGLLELDASDRAALELLEGG